MNRSRFTSLLACAVAACALIFSAVVLPAYELVVSTVRAFKNWALDGFKMAARQGEGMGRPAIRFVQARAFVLRLAKRERPVVTASWRHCPST